MSSQLRRSPPSQRFLAFDLYEAERLRARRRHDVDPDASRHAVTARRPTRAASWSALWYLLSAFAVISYTGNSIYVIFAAAGSWIGAYFSVRWLERSDSRTTPGGPAAVGNPPA